MKNAKFLLYDSVLNLNTFFIWLKTVLLESEKAESFSWLRNFLILAKSDSVSGQVSKPLTWFDKALWF